MFLSVRFAGCQQRAYYSAPREFDFEAVIAIRFRTAHDRIGRLPKGGFVRLFATQGLFRSGNSPGFVRYSAQGNPGLGDPIVLAQRNYCRHRHQAECE